MSQATLITIDLVVNIFAVDIHVSDKRQITHQGCFDRLEQYHVNSSFVWDCHILVKAVNTLFCDSVVSLVLLLAACGLRPKTLARMIKLYDMHAPGATRPFVPILFSCSRRAPA
jgi:hypothetical protein